MIVMIVMQLTTCVRFLSGQQHSSGSGCHCSDVLQSFVKSQHKTNAVVHWCITPGRGTNSLSQNKMNTYLFNNEIKFIKILIHNTFHTLINRYSVKVQVKILHMNYRPRTDFPIHVVMKCVLHVSHNECLCHITK